MATAKKYLRPMTGPDSLPGRGGNEGVDDITTVDENTDDKGKKEDTEGKEFENETEFEKETVRKAGKATLNENERGSEMEEEAEGGDDDVTEDDDNAIEEPGGKKDGLSSGIYCPEYNTSFGPHSGISYYITLYCTALRYFPL